MDIYIETNMGGMQSSTTGSNDNKQNCRQALNDYYAAWSKKPYAKQLLEHDTRKYLESQGKSGSDLEASVSSEVEKSLTGATGGGSMFGGKTEDMVKYANTVYSKSKEDLIRNIAKDVSKLLGKEKITDSMPMAKVVSILKNIIPAKGKRVSKKSDVQVKVCKTLAKIINDNYGSNLVNTDEPDNVCDSVAEVIYTLISGLHVEFLQVSDNVSKISQNLVVLQKYLKSVHDRYKALISGCSDEREKMLLKNVDDFYNSIMKETNRQISLLSNIVGSTLPKFNTNIAALVTETGDMKDAIKSVNVDLGTREFGQKLGYLLAGIDNVAQAAYLVDKSLKDVGLTLKDFKESKNVAELQEKMYKKALSKDGLTGQELQKFIKAREVLLGNPDDLHREEVIEYLEKNKKKMDSNKSGGLAASELIGGMEAWELAGGAIDTKPGPWHIKGDNNRSLKNRIAKHKKFRGILFKDFQDQLNKHFVKIVETVQNLAPLIGDKIPVSRDLYLFQKAYGNLSIANKENLAIALTGYNKTLSAQDYRSRFMESVNLLKETLRPLMNGPGDAHFKKVYEQLSMVDTLIDKFDKSFMKTISSAVTENPQDPEVKRREKRELNKIKHVGGNQVDAEIRALAAMDAPGDISGGNQVDAEIRALAAMDAPGDISGGNQVDAEIRALAAMDAPGDISGGNQVDAEIRALAAMDAPADISGGNQVDAEIRALAAMDAPGDISGGNQVDAEIRALAAMDAPADISGGNTRYDIAKIVANYGKNGGNSNALKMVSQYAMGGNKDLLKTVSQYATGGNKDLLKMVSEYSMGGDSNALRMIAEYATGGDSSGGLEERIDASRERISTARDLDAAAVAALHADKPKLAQDLQDISGGSPIQAQLADIMQNTGLISTGASSGGAEKKFVSFTQSQQELDYRIKIANLKQSLKRASRVTDRASEDYKDLLGRSIASIINSEQNKYSTSVETLTSMEEVGNANDRYVSANNMYDLYINADDAQKERARKAADAMIYVLERSYKAKKRFLEAMQNMDLLLSKFTEGIEARPDDVFELKKIMNQLVNVKEFFNNKSGDFLVGVFESFPKDIPQGNNPNGINMPNNNNTQPNFPLTENNNDYMKEISKRHYYDAVYPDSISVGKIADGVQITSKEEAEELFKRIKKAYTGVRSLENLLAMFSKLGSKFSGKNIGDYVFMRHGEMFNALNEYMTCSSVAYNRESANDGDDFDARFGKYTKVTIAPARTTDIIMPDVEPDRTRNGAWDTRFAKLDNYFAMFIKAMSAKILTVLGLYTIFNKPKLAELARYNISMSPIRTILGGGKPKVIPDALELYIRLPLLLEWYRDTLGTSRKDEAGNPLNAGDGVMIAFVPDISGVWGPIIDLIFNRTSYDNNGAYSDADTELLISEINKLYNHYKKGSAKNTLYEVVNALIDEINSRYGLLKKEEVKQYVDNKYSSDRYNDVSFGEEDLTPEPVDFDILDAKNTFGRKSAPSDKYLNYEPLKTKKDEIWSEEVRKSIISMMNKLGREFDENIINNPLTSPNIGVTLSFDETIRNYRAELRVADEGSKLAVVKKAIRGAGRYSSIANDQIIMFNETVVSPLFSLETMYQYVSCYVGKITAVKDMTDNNWDVALADTVEYCCSELINSVYSLAGYTNLVDLNIISGGTNTISLEFGAMKNLVDKSLNAIKKALAKFQLQFDRSYLELFRNVNVNGQENLASILRLEEKFNQLFIGRPDVSPAEGRSGVVVLNANIQHILSKLKEKTTGAGADSLFGGLMSNLCYWRPGTMDQQTLLRDNNKFPFNILSGAELADGGRGKILDTIEQQIATALSEGAEMKWVPGAPGMNNGVATAAVNAADPGPPPDDAGAPADVAQKREAQNKLNAAIGRLNSMGGFYINTIKNWYNRLSSPSFFNMNNSGLLVDFNKFLAKYVQQFYDSATRKYYAPLIQDFAQNTNSNEIMRGEALNDLTFSNLNDLSQNINLLLVNTSGEVGKPKPGIVVFASIARTIKVLLTRQNQAETQRMYAVDSLADVAPHVRENMKTNLPGFIKLFDIIKNRADYLKLLLSATVIGKSVRLNCDIPQAENSKRDGLYVAYDPCSNTPSETNRSYMINMLDYIKSAASSVQSCAKRVFNELNDISYFMETYDGLFKTYRKNTGKFPLTLLSNLQVALSGDQLPEASHLLPLQQNSVAATKYNRGVRGVLHDSKTGLDYFPGFVELVNSYNSMMRNNQQLDKSLIQELVSTQADIVRYVADIRVFKAQVYKNTNNIGAGGINITLCANSLPNNGQMPMDVTVDNVRTPANSRVLLGYFASFPFRYGVYQARNVNNLNNVIFMVENEDYNRDKETVSQWYARLYVAHRKLSEDSHDRKRARFLNIVDMDIQPINIHALEREVPLVNLLVYSYSFDRMLINLLNLKNIQPDPNDERQAVLPPTYSNFIGVTPGNNFSLATDRQLEGKDISYMTRFEYAYGTMLANPYMALYPIDNNNRYDKNEDDAVQIFLYNIMVGHMGIEGFSRPKYLSDQVWNKSLLKNMYSRGMLPEGPDDLRQPENILSYTKYDRNVYAASGPKAKLTSKNITDNATLKDIGNNRLDTKLARNLIWFTQLQRLMRWNLDQALKGKPNPLVYNEEVANPDNTEYYNTQVYDPNTFGKGDII